MQTRQERIMEQAGALLTRSRANVWECTKKLQAISLRECFWATNAPPEIVREMFAFERSTLPFQTLRILKRMELVMHASLHPEAKRMLQAIKRAKIEIAPFALAKNTPSST